MKKKSSILFSSGLNTFSPILIYFIVARYYGDLGINTYTIFLNSAAWFSAIISIGLPSSILLDKAPEIKPIREYLAIAISITLCSLTLSGVSALALSRIHETYFSLEFLSVALILGLSFSIQNLSQSLNDKYKRYRQTFRTSSACALAPIPAFLLDHAFSNTLESFLLTLVIVRILILFVLEASLLRETLSAFLQLSTNYDSRQLFHSCCTVTKNSFPYFVGRLATTSYSFASASIIVTIFSPALTASYFLGTRVLTGLLTVFSGFFQRYISVGLTESDATSLTVASKLFKLIRLFRTFTWSFPLLVTVFAIFLYSTSAAIPLGVTFSYQLLTLISLVFAIRFISMIIGAANTALLTKRFYLISSIIYYLLCYSLLVAVKSSNASFTFYMVAACLIEFFLLSANFLGFALYLRDSKICRFLSAPLICLVVICVGNTLMNHM